MADYNGVVYHGRNMDKEVPSTRNLTLQLSFVKSGIVIANATDYYWFNAGFVTGFKSGMVSLSENWRKSTKDYDGKKILADIYQGTIAQVWMFREALLNNNWNFDQTLQYILDKYSTAPMYGIIGGAGAWEGAIVTKDPYQQLPVYYLQPDAPNSWRLVVTNYDLWEPDPKDDPRRTVAEFTLGQMS